MSPYSAKVKTPFAVLGIRTANGMVTRIQYLPTSERSQAPTDSVAERAVREVERYLADPHFRFSLPLASTGTPFRRRVWQLLAGIPVGESRTYGELARALHTAPRAVGGACAANQIALVIPCHRVVGSHGSLGGFMSAKGRPERELLPLGGTARSAKGAPICAKGRPEGELLPRGGKARSAESAPISAVDGDPIAIKRWLLKHEGYRFGA
jgi:methylated-DNA-[protein]-cysteine S-methyltransferase